MIAGDIARMDVVLLSCAKLAEPTPSDARLGEALRERGATVRHAAWNALDPAAQAGRLLVFRSTWDYFLRFAEFTAWLSSCEAAGVSLQNPVPLERWNMDKGYLRDLAAAGVAMPETLWFAPGERVDLGQVLSSRGWDEAVVKPRVSGTAHGTHRVPRGASLTRAEWAPIEAAGAVVQAFVPEVSQGEWSLVFVGGRYAHAVRKVPKAGEFRVQRDFGGTVERGTPSRAALTLACAALAAIPGAAVYARVDLLETATGPQLMELELIEPELFISEHPESAGPLADALLATAPRRAAPAPFARVP